MYGLITEDLRQLDVVLDANILDVHVKSDVPAVSDEDARQVAGNLHQSWVVEIAL